MRALLICPAIRLAVPRLADNGPLATVPILGGCLAAQWIEHLSALGARHVSIISADRANVVRAHLGDGAQWGVQLEVIAATLEPTPAHAAALYRPPGETGWLPAPQDVQLMSHLPGCPDYPLFESYAGWFAALLAWMPRALTPARVRVREISPGIWVGQRSHVASTAQLRAPCWIGDQVFVEPGAIVGPGAILEDRTVVEGEARIAQSWVGPDTLVGPMTAVTSSLAWGSSLTNWCSDSSLHVPDPFLLCSLAPASPPAVAPSAPKLPAPARQPCSPATGVAAWPPQIQPSLTYSTPT